MERASDYTLGDILRRNATVHGDGIAFREQDGAVTHRAHWRRVQQLAAGLHRLGVAQGDRVAILSKNRIEYVELLGAAAQLGAIVSAINWRLSAAEVLAVLENDTPKTVLAEDEFWPLLDLSLARTGPDLEPITIGIRREGFQCLDDLYIDDGPLPSTPLSADAPLLLIHTAWTDGRPKAATISHANLISNAIQLQGAWKLGTDDVHLCCLPLFHSTAISLVLAVQLAGGGSVLTRQYEPQEAASLVERHRATVLGEFAPMLDGLLSACDGVPSRLRSLRHVCGLDSPETIRRFEAACPDATFWAGYGQTEVSGLATLGRFRDAPGAAGFPLALCAIGIEGDDGRLVPDGEAGEIVVRGPSACLGYWQRPEDNARLLRGGWLHTGDSGRIDANGRLWYTGRLAAKELIKTGGENVYPSEVEAVIRQHAGIAEVAVIGVPDAQWGESIKAICVPARTPPPAQEEVADFVASRIARYKRPRFVVFADSLPKKPDGSADREQIRKLHG
ncbi:AMP-binding protein [Variovorax sp. LjRoot290]|uniref:AMP-binding protein n=1 Tax=unclassified Variovorax TaxID=663243 RepID=UPI003ECD7E91